MLDKTPTGNLTTPSANPAASRADIRTPRAARPRPVAVPQTMMGGRPTGFEAAMAMSDAQSQILGEVLEGPVSQQTQRQLASIRESAARGQLAQELRQGRNPELARAVLQNEGIAAASGAAGGTDQSGAAAAATATAGAAAQSAPNRRPAFLAAGATIAAGLDTGRIFTPAQLAAFKQRAGLALDARRGAAPGQASGADVAAEAASSGAADMPVLEAAAARLAAGTSTGSQAAAASQSLAEPAKPSAGTGDIDGIIERVGQALGLDPSLIKAVIKAESNFNERAVSPAGAQGLMQLMPGTAREMGVKDPFNPMDNIWGGARYLKRMLDSHGGNLNKALAAYNWGPGNLRRSGGRSMPRETRRYIETVNRNYAHFKSEAGRA
jgi:soluble lytic murein transglycosylase-like protein